MGNAISTEEEWIQTLFGHLTPRFKEFSEDVLSSQIEPLVQKAFPKSKVPGVEFKFVKMDLGDIPPKIDNIETHKTNEEDQGLAKAITIDFDFAYCGNCDLQVSVLGIVSGVRDLQILGRARIVLKPKSKRMPLVGGLKFCFLDIPKISYDLDGLADLCDWSPIRRKIRREIEEDVGKKCVFPNCFKMVLSDSVDVEAVKALDPSGIVQARLISASGLPCKGGLRSLIGQDKPDPYGKLMLGSQIYDTSVVKNCEDPEFPEEKFDFLVDTQKGNRLRINLYDEDSMSRDDFLGFIEVATDDLVPGEVQNLDSLELKDDSQENDSHKPTEISGTLSLEIAYLPLLNLDQVEQPALFVFSFFVYSCNNLVQDFDSDVYPSSRLEISLNENVQVTEVKKDNPHPNFESDFLFTLKDIAGQTAIATVIDTDAGTELGRLELDLEDLSANPIRRKIRSMSEENPLLTITFSANVKAC